VFGNDRDDRAPKLSDAPSAMAAKLYEEARKLGFAQDYKAMETLANLKKMSLNPKITYPPSSLPPTTQKPMSNSTNSYFDPAQDNTRVYPIELLAVRLRIPTKKNFATKFGNLDEVHVYLGTDKAFIFYVANGKGGVLEDDVKLYPSDDLCAQMRLLLGTQ